MLKKYGLLLGGFGFSYFGNWIYLIALNLLVLDLTGSAAAVAGIFIVGPVARIFTNIFAGSIIDRANKRKLMMTADILRGLLVCLVPFMHSIWIIYLILFISNMAGAFFGPSSTYYITKYVDDEDRRKFNAWLGMMNSGSFLVGPALAGVLILMIGTHWTIIINGLTFFICVFAIYLLPDIDANARKVKAVREKITLRTISEDFQVVKRFILTDRIFFKIYVAFQVALMIAFALDSQEVTFLKQNLALSDQTYGFMVSVAGVGSLIGATVAANLTKRLSLKSYVTLGLLLTMVGYTAFYASFNFWSALLAFICLGFFAAFSNAGYETFYQKNVPTDIMGRFGSLASMFQSILQIMFTFLLGVSAELFTLQYSAIVFGCISIACTLVLLFVVYANKSTNHFKETPI
ncbi:MFS transporter [Lysinibacillus fusiformis]|nr:MFS transporter [Lysinibacillus fusiformis]